jgi:hypothetical protein
MKTIKIFNGNEPCIDETYVESQKCYFGLHRDRYPDRDWSEFRSTRMSEAKEVELTDKLKKILIQDICEYYNGEKAYKKLIEFDLIK